jgi:predicted hotdog family 3-hydroxylacyl-ACP dehydratase
MLMDKNEIQSLIPHAGTMCLLDAVTAWDMDSITCLSMTHTDSANPLRRHRQLAALHAFEYGAQVLAIHGGLLARTAGRQAPPAYLAALRDAHLHVTRLDDIPTPLEITAKQLVGQEGNAIYEIQVNTENRLLASANVTIIARRKD